ncbi:MAG: hypothetical protein WA959_05570 [Rivularia sp. (in: cyanobacteria)]
MAVFYLTGMQVPSGRDVSFGDEDNEGARRSHYIDFEGFVVSALTPCIKEFGRAKAAT